MRENKRNAGREKRYRNRILSMMLAVLLVLQMMPVSAIPVKAENVEATGGVQCGDFYVVGGTEGNDYRYQGDQLTILTSTPLTITTPGKTPENPANGFIYNYPGVTANFTLQNVSMAGTEYGTIIVCGTTNCTVSGQNYLFAPITFDGKDSAFTIIGGQEDTLSVIQDIGGGSAIGVGWSYGSSGYGNISIQGATVCLAIVADNPYMPTLASKSLQLSEQAKLYVYREQEGTQIDGNTLISGTGNVYTGIMPLGDASKTDLIADCTVGSNQTMHIYGTQTMEALNWNQMDYKLGRDAALTITDLVIPSGKTLVVGTAAGINVTNSLKVEGTLQVLGTLHYTGAPEQVTITNPTGLQVVPTANVSENLEAHTSAYQGVTLDVQNGPIVLDEGSYTQNGVTESSGNVYSIINSNPQVPIRIEDEMAYITVNTDSVQITLKEIQATVDLGMFLWNKSTGQIPIILDGTSIIRCNDGDCLMRETVRKLAD